MIICAQRWQEMHLAIGRSTDAREIASPLNRRRRGQGSDYLFGDPDPLLFIGRQLRADIRVEPDAARDSG